MTPPAHSPELDELRSRVDEIDRSILDLLGERLDVVMKIAAEKRRAGHAGLALRPAREALIIRRLVERSAGRVPRSTLVRMWRELLAATTRAQTPFQVCAYVPPHQPELWDIVRDHFGSLTPVQRVEGAGQALRLVTAGRTPIAVLPLPEEADRWWAGLLDGGSAGPRIVARLPFARLPGYPEDVGGLALAALPAESTGDDLSLIGIETDGTVSAAGLRDLLVPLQGVWLAGHRDPEQGLTRHLIEVAGFIEPGSSRVGELLAPLRGRLLRAVTLGCYARPLPAAAAEPG